MRMLHDPQLALDRPQIADIVLNPECRDRMVPVLRGLQHLYSVPDLRDKLLQLVSDDVFRDVDPELGREGFSCWQVTVLAAVRLGCNFTYDHLQDLAENHRALMQMLQVGSWEEESFNWQRIRDNVTLLSQETVEQISWVIVEAGHRLRPDAAEKIRGDSFVVETNIHYPTESSLILDGLKKILTLGRELADDLDLPGWRQSKSLLKKAKRSARAAARIQKGTYYEHQLQAAYQGLFDIADLVLPRTQVLLDYLFTLSGQHLSSLAEDLLYWHAVTHHVLGTAKRRVLEGETVPNDDKLFSLFEPDTELIKRGKAKNPNQFGHSVLIFEDAAGFVCGHKIVPLHTLDQEILISEMTALQSRMDGRICSASFDRGFNTPANQAALAAIVDHPCIPMTGTIQSQKQEKEATVEFHEARQRHPGIESAIGALQSGNGMKRCRDRSSPGFKRYVGLAVLGRNIHTLGKIVLADEYPGCCAAESKRDQAA